jgi:hypothetical protein
MCFRIVFHNPDSISLRIPEMRHHEQSCRLLECRLLLSIGVRSLWFVRRHLLEIPIQNLPQGRRVALGSETEPEKKSSQQQGNNPDEVPVDQDNYTENSAYCGS